MSKAKEMKEAMAAEMAASEGSIEVMVGNKAGRVPYLTVRAFAAENGYTLEKEDVGLWTLSVSDGVAEVAEAITEDMDEDYDEGTVEALEDMDEDEDAEDEQDEVEAELAEVA